MDASPRNRIALQALCCCALLGAFFLSGCASPGAVIASPAVRLESVELHKLGLSGQTFKLGFVVHNPNSFALPVRNVRYEIRLDKERFAGGETRSGFVIAPTATARFSISVELDLMHSASGFNTLLEDGFERTVYYELNGSLRIDLRSADAVPFSESGHVRLNRDGH
jgi:LEA14-like dessication related protein